MELPLLVSIRFQVLFHSPNRGAFHLSLTVLCSLSVMYEYLGLEGGPPMFAYGAVTRYGHTFQSVLLVETKALAWSRFARHYYGNLC